MGYGGCKPRIKGIDKYTISGIIKIIKKGGV